MCRPGRRIMPADPGPWARPASASQTGPAAWLFLDGPALPEGANLWTPVVSPHLGQTAGAAGALEKGGRGAAEGAWPRARARSWGTLGVRALGLGWDQEGNAVLILWHSCLFSSPQQLLLAPYLGAQSRLHPFTVAEWGGRWGLFPACRP